MESTIEAITGGLETHGGEMHLAGLCYIVTTWLQWQTPFDGQNGFSQPVADWCHSCGSMATSAQKTPMCCMPSADLLDVA